MSAQGLRIAFMGTPPFTVPVLEKLIASRHKIVCVYTQPPRPRGRGNKMRPTAVHEWAEQQGIEVRTPVSLKKDEAARTAFLQSELDAAIIAGYGMMLPHDILEGPRFGCLNIHPSLLPRWRGTSPVQHAIWKGDKETGVTIIRLVEKMDAGPTIAQQKIAIGPMTTSVELDSILWPMGADMLVAALDRLASGEKITFSPQDESLATYTPLLTRDDGRVDWAMTAAEIDCQIRALNPWPGVWTQTRDGKRLKILEAQINPSTIFEPPGTVLNRDGDIACGDGTFLRLMIVQPENTKPMTVAAAVNGGYLDPGTAFLTDAQA